MSCNQEAKGSYKIGKKSEYNKLIKFIVEKHNQFVTIINDKKKSMKSRKKWELLSDKEQATVVYTVFKKDNWSYVATGLRTHGWYDEKEELVGKVWNKDIKKITQKDLKQNLIHNAFFKHYDVEFDEAGYISIYCDENNHSWDDLQYSVGFHWLYHALENVKWMKTKANRDGGYMRVEDEYSDGADYQMTYGIRGKEIRVWANNQPW